MNNIVLPWFQPTQAVHVRWTARELRRLMESIPRRKNRASRAAQLKTLPDGAALEVDPPDGQVMALNTPKTKDGGMGRGRTRSMRDDEGHPVLPGCGGSARGDPLAALSPQLMVDLLYIIAELGLMPAGGGPRGSRQFLELCGRIRVRGESRRGGEGDKGDRGIRGAIRCCPTLPSDPEGEVSLLGAIPEREGGRSTCLAIDI